MELKRWLKGILPFALVLSSAACGPKDKDPICGNGAQEINAAKGLIEFCDDGNTAAGDGCDADCRIEFNAEDHRCDLPPGFQNGFGGCCNVAEDCLSASCSFGHCDSAAACAQDADCNNALAADALTTNASPYPDGTTFSCVPFLVDTFGPGNAFCVAGSGVECDSPNDVRCAADETCTMTFDDSGAPLDINGFSGICTKNYLGSAGPGEFCTGDPGAPYECSAGIFFANCIGNTCMSACDGNDANADDVCGAGFECLGPLNDVDLGGGNLAGGAGFCVGAICGSFTVSLDAEDEAIDLTRCDPGFGCSFFGAFDDINFLTYQCIPDAPNAAPNGAACEQDAFFEQFCAGGGLCLQGQPAEDPNGAACSDSSDCCPAGAATCTDACQDDNGDGNGRCTARGEAGFCAIVCENHDTCNGDPNVPSTCIDLPIDANNDALVIPICLAFDDFDLLFAAGFNFCSKEADCTTAGQGCVPAALAGLGDRAGLGICEVFTDAGVTGKAEGDACDVVNFAGGTGTACTTDAQCVTAGELCIDDGSGGKCRPQITECLSAICADANLDLRVSSDPAALDIRASQTFCTSYCITNADCSANMECNPVLTEDNTDGIVGGISGQSNTIGLCMPAAPVDPADNCTIDAAATAHNSCEVDENAGSGLACIDDATCAVVDPNDVCFNDFCRALVAGEGDSCNLIAGDCFTDNAGAGADCDADAQCDLGGTCITDDAAGTGFCAFNGCDSTFDGILAGCATDNELCLGNGSAAPGTCILSCDPANVNADCTAVNAALECVDLDGVAGGEGVCLLP